MLACLIRIDESMRYGSDDERTPALAEEGIFEDAQSDDVARCGIVDRSGASVVDTVVETQKFIKGEPRETARSQSKDKNASTA